MDRKQSRSRADRVHGEEDDTDSKKKRRVQQATAAMEIPNDKTTSTKHSVPVDESEDLEDVRKIINYMRLGLNPNATYNYDQVESALWNQLRALNEGKPMVPSKKLLLQAVNGIVNGDSSNT